MKLTQEKIIIGLGIWLLVLPFTGFPSSWKTLLTVATGVVVIYLGALLFKKARTRARSASVETKTGTFIETL